MGIYWAGFLAIRKETKKGITKRTRSDQSISIHTFERRKATYIGIISTSFCRNLHCCKTYVRIIIDLKREKHFTLFNLPSLNRVCWFEKFLFPAAGPPVLPRLLLGRAEQEGEGEGQEEEGRRRRRRREGEIEHQENKETMFKQIHRKSFVDFKLLRRKKMRANKCKQVALV